MKVPKSYYEDEVRDGFYVPGMMKRAWAASIEVLEEIGRICTKYGIQYFMDCGTLLGAVRHQGFIPWDDDLDICMKRLDYQRFIEVADQELSEYFELYRLRSDEDEWNMITRVINTRSFHLDDQSMNRFHGCPFIVGVDIFVMDDLAPDEEKQQHLEKLIHAVFDAEECWEQFGHTITRELEQRLRAIEASCKTKINRKLSMKCQLNEIKEQLYSLYQAENAEEVTEWSIRIDNGTFQLRKEYYQQAIMLPFEFIEVPVPLYYDAVLRKRYGNYMELVHRGSAHDYPLYEPQRKQMEEKLGILRPYTVSKSDLVRGYRPKIFSEALQEDLAFYSMEHEHLNKALESKDIETAYSILEKCQGRAIAMGTRIEQRISEPGELVHLLEEYCENVYQIYSGLQAGCTQDYVEYLQGMGTQIACLEELLKDVQVHTEIVFLPYKAKLWDGFDSLWQELRSNPKNDVYVIPIPYFEKDAYGRFGEKHYEGKDFPAHVPIMDFNQYDFETRCPDVIYIQNPFDEYNTTTNVFPQFYSSKLKHETANLIYIPPFVIDEVDPEDERGVLSLEHFVTMPGVVHADKVYVQSEQMKKTYVDKLAQWAGETTRELWEKKISGEGLPIQHRKKINTKEQSLPESWQAMIRKPDGGDRKVILYCTSISMLIEYQDRMLAKMRDVFGIFAENGKEVVVLWHPDVVANEAVKAMKPTVWQEYMNLVEWFCEKRIGIYEPEGELELLADVCDGYYGDNDYLMTLCRRRGKPIMVQNVDILASDS